MRLHLMLIFGLLWRTTQRRQDLLAENFVGPHVPTGNRRAIDQARATSCMPGSGMSLASVICRISSNVQPGAYSSTTMCPRATRITATSE